MANKTCSKCGVEKDVSEFSKDNHRKDGLQASCKMCYKEYREANRDKIRAKKKEYNELNKEEILIKKKEYREANHDKILAKQKELYEAVREKRLAEQKEYREANREKINAYMKERYQVNREKILAEQKEYREANREKILVRNKKYYETNRDKILLKNKTQEAREKMNEYNKKPKVRARINKRKMKKYKEDPQFRIKDLLRRRVNKVLKTQGAEKFTNTMNLIGCSPEFLTKHLEKQIKPGTKREDYHVDHIIPCALFDLTKEEEQRLCFHWTNLQLLLGPANMSKSDDVFWCGQVYKPDEVPSEIREEIYAHCRSNMTLRSS